MSSEACRWLLEGPLPVRGVCDMCVAYSEELQGLLLHEFRCPSKRLVIAEVPGCSQVVFGTDDGYIFVWDAVTNQRVMLMGHMRHHMWISTIAAITDSLLAVGDWAGNVRILERAKDHTRSLHVLGGHTNCINVFTVLPDGRLVSGSEDDTMRVWDVRRGACTCVLEGHTGAVRVLTLLPKAKLASGSADHTVRVWDTSTWACLWSLVGHQNGVCSVVPCLRVRLRPGHPMALCARGTSPWVCAFGL